MKQYLDEGARITVLNHIVPKRMTIPSGAAGYGNWPGVAQFNVNTDATPTAAAVATTLVYMGEHYAGDDIYLELLVSMSSGGKQDARTFEFIWNPTSTTVADTAAGALRPQSLLVREVALSKWSPVVAPRGSSLVVSSVTTSALLADGSGVLEQVRHKTGLQ